MHGKTLAEQLHEAIQNCGFSNYELSRRSGVSQAQISRFLSGKRTLTLTVAGTLCQALGLSLTPSAAILKQRKKSRERATAKNRD